MTECKRCGACCWYEKNGKLVKCKWLTLLDDGKTSCRIYSRSSRIHRIIDTKTEHGFVIPIICKNREEVKKSYPNCPYNDN